MALSTESKRNIGLVILLLILGAVWLGLPKKTDHVGNNSVQPSPAQPAATDPADISYNIEGEDVLLKNGQQQEGDEVTKIFDANTQGDINGDGATDTVVMLTQERGGSGTFFYVAAALKTQDGYTGTNAVLIGDRIAPQNTEVKDGLVTVNYAKRNPDEPFSVQPSVGQSMYVEYFNGTLIARPEEIQVTEPHPYEEISSPLTITGQARGMWYFEASFPVILTDRDGKIIAQNSASALNDWMTEDFVPFTVTLNFTKPTGNNTGTLILKKDNPSGLPQNDQAYEIPVIFK